MTFFHIHIVNFEIRNLVKKKTTDFLKSFLKSMLLNEISKVEIRYCEHIALTLKPYTFNTFLYSIFC